MAVGKSKRSGKKGQKKKTVDSMAKKEWYDVVAPSSFAVRQFTKSVGNKTIGTKVGADNMRGRVFEANLGDLQQQVTGEAAFRAVKLRVEDVQGRSAITQFYGYRLTTDKYRAAMRKWCSTIEGVVEAKTRDGYNMRLFINAFTSKQKNQLSKNCYAKSRLIRWIRSRFTKVVQRRLSKADINETVKMITNETLVNFLKKRCNPLFPLRDIQIIQVKVLRTPKFDAVKLMESHKGSIPQSQEELGRIVEEVAAEAAPADAKADAKAE